MTLILNGKEVRDVLMKELSETIQTFETVPTLVIIQVGDRADSTSYINQKKIFAEKIGAKVIHKHYTDPVSQEEVLEDIKHFNKDIHIHGIIVQIPLPSTLNKDILIEAINPAKDVDGLTTTNANYLLENSPKAIVPATTRGILSLLKYYNIPVEGKTVTVVGRSNLVGKPTAIALSNKKAFVTVAHSLTENLKSVCVQSEILIVAIGDPLFITKEYVKPGQVVIDVGINTLNSKLVGDVAFEEVKDIVTAITPVPGGVGPMTVLSLFQNLVDAYSVNLPK